MITQYSWINERKGRFNWVRRPDSVVNALDSE
jgi:hypothetical protein